MRSLLTILLLCLTFTLSGQRSFTISGTITDSSNGEYLTGVVVYDSISKSGTITNNYGYYSLTLKSSRAKLLYTTLGFERSSMNLSLKGDSSISVAMKAAVTELGEVVISERSFSSVHPGAIALKTVQIRTAPVLMGEGDLLKTIQLLPGIKSGTEGTSGLYVRGGSPDQNLIILDGVPIYNSSHAFGFFSVFNPDAISGFTFYKGGIPARYSGRLSSVLDIKMKEGNNKHLSGTASLGIIASDFLLEGPLGGENTSFFISGRRTFIDLLTIPFRNTESELSFPAYYFYDINAKINHRFSDRNRIYLSIYNGSDHEGTTIKGTSEDMERDYLYKDGYGWGNLTTSLRWTSTLSSKIFSNLTLYYSKYRFSIYRIDREKYNRNDSVNYNSSDYYSGIKDLGSRWDIDWYPSSRHTIRAGLNFTRHIFTPGITLVKNTAMNQVSAIDTTLGNKTFVNEAYIYAEDEFSISEIVKSDIGLNYTVFAVSNKSYRSLQPRISLSIEANDKLNIKSSFGLMSQFLHLLTNSTTGLPTDLWLPVTARVKPQKAWQVSSGIEYSFNKVFRLSVEAYYKKMDNLIDYSEGASFFKLKGDWADQIEVGKGKSKGVEVLLQKESGKTTGWVGLTLSKTTRKFDNINNGIEYHFRYDRRLDISIMAIHKFNDRINMSGTWVFGTGNWITLPEEKIQAYNGVPLSTNSGSLTYLKNVTSINNFQTPAYHRLDIGVEFHKKKKGYSRTWSIGAYNAYNRKNPFYIYADMLDKPPVMKQVSIFPVLPYIKYSISF